MLTLPETYCTLISEFALIFSKRVWRHTQVLLIGAILAPGKRTVTSVLRVMGLSDERHFQNYHRVLSRAIWSSLEVSRLLLMLLVNTFVSRGPVVIGIDETLERRRGAKIKAKGIYRDPVRSSRSHFVKTSGLRWLSAMLLVPIPWAKRVWALPFLTALAPSERFYEGKARGHKKLTDWARQVLLQVRRWLPKRTLVAVADSSYVRSDFASGTPATLAKSDLYDNAHAIGCCLVRASSATQTGQKGTAAAERSPVANVGANTARPKDHLEEGDDSGLVW